MKKYNFFYDFLIKRNEIPFNIKSLNDKEFVSEIKELSFFVEQEKLKGSFHFDTVPDYLNLGFPGWYFKRVPTYQGSLINLKNYPNIETYLKAKFNTKKLSKFRSTQKRLEYCFDIRYQAYYGEIEKEEYLRLFNRVIFFVSSRFEKLGVENEELTLLKENIENIYHRILRKECCFFVIYNDDEPISIGISFVYGSTGCCYMNAYDINFSKFYLGLLLIHKQFEWYMNNKFETLDLLVGNYDYKDRYADVPYQFYNYVIYSGESFFFKLLVSVKFNFKKILLGLIFTAKKYNVHILLGNIIGRKYYSKSSNHCKHKKQYELTEIKKEDIPPDLGAINLKDKENSFLLEPVYTFLYSSQKNVNEVKVFSLPIETNNYLIIANDKIKKLVLY